jgi:hypothetical protein
MEIVECKTTNSYPKLELNYMITPIFRGRTVGLEPTPWILNPRYFQAD